MALGLRGANPIWLLDDLTGNLFDDTFYLYVLQNVLPYVPATVYHDPDLLIPWTSPIQFLANGTLPINIFFESEIVYRLEFRQNTGSLPPSQNDALIYEVNDYTAGSGGSTPIDNVSFSTGNQVTNPQFSLINFTSPLTISATNPAPTAIAPGWSFVAAGTGTATIRKVPLDRTNTNPSNAPYALRLTLTGWTAGSVFLKQRFQQNGMLWAGEYVSSAITARLDGSPPSISASLIDSNSAVLGVVLPSTVVNESWNEFTGHALLPATTNPNVPPAAYIEYSLALPSNIDIYLTSFQLVAQDLPLEPKFEQESIDRQIDHTFHYYKDPLSYKPVPSYLVGWDFPLNPTQFGSSIPIAAGANVSHYVWDQTILFQTATNSISVARASSNNGIVFTRAADSSFAVIQYLPSTQARLILGQQFSVQLQGKTGASTVNGTVSCYWTTGATLPAMSANTSLVASITAGVPTVTNGTWTAVKTVTGVTALPFALTSSASTTSFEGFNSDLAGKDTATFFAIVVTLDTLTAAVADVTLSYVSLVGGTIATRPAPQTQDQVLRECQYYYTKSFSPATAPIQNSAGNSAYGLQNVGSAGSGDGPFVRFPSPMRVAPTARVTLYNPNAANAQIRNISVPGDYSGSNANSVTEYGFLTSGASNVGSALVDVIAVNWSADARLGFI